jgi:hypothetical protein
MKKFILDASAGLMLWGLVWGVMCSRAFLWVGLAGAVVALFTLDSAKKG